MAAFHTQIPFYRAVDARYQLVDPSDRANPQLRPEDPSPLENVRHKEAALDPYWQQKIRVAGPRAAEISRLSKVQDVFVDPGTLNVLSGNKGMSLSSDLDQLHHALRDPDPFFYIVIPSGTAIPDGLSLVQTSAWHWQLNPSQNMTLAAYRQLLFQLTVGLPILARADVPSLPPLHPDDDHLLHPRSRILVNALRWMLPGRAEGSVLFDSVYFAAMAGTLDDLSQLEEEEKTLIIGVLKEYDQHLASLQTGATSGEAYDLGDERFPLGALIQHLCDPPRSDCELTSNEEPETTRIEEAFDDLRSAIDGMKTASDFCIICLKRRTPYEKAKIHSHIIPDACLADASRERNIKVVDLETAKKKGHRKFVVNGFCQSCEHVLGVGEEYLSPYFHRPLLLNFDSALDVEALPNVSSAHHGEGRKSAGVFRGLFSVLWRSAAIATGLTAANKVLVLSWLEYTRPFVLNGATQDLRGSLWIGLHTEESAKRLSTGAPEYKIPNPTFPHDDVMVVSVLIGPIIALFYVGPNNSPSYQQLEQHFKQISLGQKINIPAGAERQELALATWSFAETFQQQSMALKGRLGQLSPGGSDEEKAAAVPYKAPLYLLPSGLVSVLQSGDLDYPHHDIVQVVSRERITVTTLRAKNSSSAKASDAVARFLGALGGGSDLFVWYQKKDGELVLHQKLQGYPIQPPLDYTSSVVSILLNMDFF